MEAGMKYFKYTLYIGILMLCVLAFPKAAHAATQGMVTANRVNVRSYAEANDYNRLFQVDRGQLLEVVGTDGDFFRVNIEENKNVYVARDFVQIFETYGTVIFGNTNIYDMPRHKGGQVISRVNDDNIVTVTSVFENWFGISYMGELAFVERAVVRVPYFVELETVRLPGSVTLGEEIVEFAKQYIGTRYVFGGTTPSGFDCSGFMMYVLSNFGISVNRVSRDQARNGVQVNRSDLEAGDLVFFAASVGGSRITHVGMYIGGGRFIHSSTFNTGVRISDINSNYHTRRFVTARRVV